MGMRMLALLQAQYCCGPYTPVTVALHSLQAVTSAWSRGENNTCAFVLYGRPLPCAPPQTLRSRRTGHPRV